MSVVFGWLMFLVALYIPFFQTILRVIPLDWSDWLIVIGLGLIKLTLVELGKLVFISPRFKIA